MNTPTAWKPGDLVVHEETRCSVRPEPAALRVRPSPQGELYTYVVADPAVVLQLGEQGVIIVTVDGQQRLVSPRGTLRRMRWWERMRLGRRLRREPGPPPERRPGFLDLL